MGVLVIQDGGGDPPPVETTTILYKFSAEDYLAFPDGSEHLVQAPFPLDPTKPKPVLYHPVTGEKADIIPAAWDKYGRADMHQLVIPHIVDGPGTTLQLTTDPEVPKLDDPTPQFNTANMDDYTVHIHTTSTVVFSARLGDGVMRRVWRSGKWVDEREYFVRSSGPENEPGPGVRFFVDRRADESIWVVVFIENTMFTVSHANLRGIDPDGTGEVFFSKITHDGTPANHFVRMSEMEQPSANTGAGEIVKPENVMGGSGPEQLLPNGSEYMFSYVFRSSLSNTAKADSIGQYMGYGLPVAGDHTVYTAKGIGSNSAYGLDTSDARVNHEGHGLTGIDSTIARDTNWLATLKTRIQAGSAHPGSGNFVQARTGLYYPYGPEAIRDAGGEGVDLRGLGSLHGEGFRIAHLRTIFTLQRAGGGLCDPITGDQIPQEDLVAANGGSAAHWSMSFRSKMGSESWNRKLPCFARQGYTQQARFNPSSDSNMKAARAMAIETRGYNKPQTLGSADPDGLPDSMQQRRVGEKRNSGAANHNEPDGDHDGRIFGCLDPLAWGANRGFAKHLLIRKGIATQRFISRFGIDSSAEAQSINGEYYNEAGSMVYAIGVMVANGKLQNAGYGRVFRNRGTGMHTVCVANAFRFMELDSDGRANALAWLGKEAEHRAAVCTEYGLGLRRSAMSEDGIVNALANDTLASGYALQQYPASDYALGLTDMVGRTGALPLDTTIVALPNQHGISSDPGYHIACAQTFQAGFDNIGGTGAALSMALPGSPTWERLALGKKFALAMYRWARRPGQLVPPSIFPVHEGSGGDVDAPGTNQGPWPGGEIRPGAWEHVQQNFVDPANGISFSFNTEWDHRQLLLMGNAMLMCVEENNQAELDELLQYLKDFAGVPAGSVDNLIDAFYGVGGSRGAAYNGESQAQPYQAEYLRVQYGGIIGVLRGLQHAGLLEGTGGGGSGTPPLAPTLVSATPTVGGLDLEVTLATGGEPAVVLIVHTHIDGQPFTQALYRVIATLDQANAPTYTLSVPNLDPELQTVRVFARNGSGANSPASNELTATPDSDGGTGSGLAAPANLEAVAGSGSAGIIFDGVEGAAVYYALIGTEPGVYTRAEWLGTSLSATIWGLTNGTDYYIVVEARTSEGIAGPDSNEVWVNPPDQQGAGGGNPPTPPDAPANIAATPGDGEVSITWN